MEDLIRGLNGVTEVHDLHIWGVSTTEIALTAHIVVPVVGDDDAILLGTCNELHRRFGIDHVTIQVERGSGPYDCRQAIAGVV